MFIKYSNNRKKMIAKAESKGFRINKALTSRTTLFTYMTRKQDGVISKVSVSYRKRHPMVEIVHLYEDGTKEAMQMVLLDQRAWKQINAYLMPEAPPALEKKKEA
jgi:hypothetical protein